ncbi:MAG: T9SS type A sorting domain-containing protein [Bacteroidetes bacterium]|nr:T9SS type A sorting domain-containing protein [Bacteroidota bacterium]MCL1968305.1 T9SS type A sorting domain-containing protein [Bacteroidota bacterium]
MKKLFILFFSVIFTLFSLHVQSQTFTITATSAGEGEIIPSGVAYVEYGAHSEIYVFDASPGYHAHYAIIDGVNNALAVFNGFHRFMDVTENHTIHVIFKPNNFTIVATASEGGVINEMGVVTVAYGTNKTLYFEPFAGYKTVRVIIDGIDNEQAVEDGFYTFENVSGNHQIAAQFEKVWYDVTYQPVPGALVAPVVGYTSPVKYGTSYLFTIVLEEGCSQSNILVRVNGIPLNPTGDVYAITNIFMDQVITIEGVVLNKYELVAKAFNGGTITPAGVFVVTHGESKTFTITPDPGFKVSNVVVNGESKGAIETYTFFDIRGNSTIKAYFEVPQGINNIDETAITVFSHNNTVTIMNNQLIPVKQVDIIDMYGRLIWTGQAFTEKTDISLDVATGIYGVRITTESNTITTKVSITK